MTKQLYSRCNVKTSVHCDYDDIDEATKHYIQGGFYKDAIHCLN